MSPLYSYECAPCKKRRTDIRCIADRERGPECDRCRQSMTLVITSPPMAIVKNPAVPRGPK